MKRVRIYKRFERFWHWGQALLVILLALTGFTMHYHWALMPWDIAVLLHKVLAWVFVVLIALAVFWHFTTGEWKQYVPGQGNVIAMAMYYLFGVFRRQPHPVQKTVLSKLNPLQKIAYLGLKMLVVPVLVTSGFLYYFYNDWALIGLGGGRLEPVALVHTLAAFALVAFMFAHTYLTTMGDTPLSNLKAMITGWETLAVDPDPEADPDSDSNVVTTSRGARR